MGEVFDAAPYVRAPIITVQNGVTLALALVDACPKKPAANVAKACKHLKKTAEGARDALAQRNRIAGVYSEEDSRILDNEADRCWGALRLRIQALAMLPADQYPRAQRAAELDKRLFSAGTEFLKADYDTQSGAMSAVLKHIQDDGLAAEIDDIAGPELLKAVRDVQPRYEAMVSERLRRNKVTGLNLADIVRNLQGAIVNYATKIAGTVEHDDPATAEAARVALLPIANFREAAAVRDARGQRGEGGELIEGGDEAGEAGDEDAGEGDDEEVEDAGEAGSAAPQARSAPAVATAKPGLATAKKAGKGGKAKKKAGKGKKKPS